MFPDMPISAEGTIVMHDALDKCFCLYRGNTVLSIPKHSVEHDVSVIEDFCHVSTAAVINGGVNSKIRELFLAVTL